MELVQRLRQAEADHDINTIGSAFSDLAISLQFLLKNLQLISLTDLSLRCRSLIELVCGLPT